jgi:hypothetical protein
MTNAEHEQPMRALSAQDIVLLWEVGKGLHPLECALLILGRAWPEYGRDALIELPLGRRDALLLELRRQVFGDRLEASVNCPACGQALDVSTRCTTLLGPSHPEPLRLEQLELEGVRYVLRCPDSRDAAAAAVSGSGEEATRVLLTRCLVPTVDDTDPLSARRSAATELLRLSESSQQVVANELARLDPQAEISFKLSCASCGHGWEALFDIASFLWKEICARARRSLQEVDTLARVYHWSEGEILRLSDARRATYLQLALS